MESLDLERPIDVGDVIPGGLSFFESDGDTKSRLIDIALGKRILMVGVIGAFTPNCWNEHMFRILSSVDYYAERGVSSICIIAANDTFTMAAWRSHLGELPDIVRMYGDVSTRFIRLIGMGLRYPRMFPGLRSRRFIILADNLRVQQVLVAPDSGKEIIKCVHLVPSPFLQEQKPIYRKRFIKKRQSIMSTCWEAASKEDNPETSEEFDLPAIIENQVLDAYLSV